MSDHGTDIMIIGKDEYEVEEKSLKQIDLKFYPENPRVYSNLNVADGTPSQDEIEEIMINLEHVKQLKLSIEANGGLIDPLIVRDGDLVVLEGNSRLAAYRLLARKDPTKWGRVRCKVLPDNIPEKAIFALLGQYHIIGRKDWSPYEQAGYLYRRVNIAKIPVDYIVQELGISKTKANNFINVYQFMVEHNDVKAERWSYYEEYLKSASIRKYRETHANLDDTIVEQIKTGQILQAIDIRDKLVRIAKVNGKEAKKIMAEVSEGKIDIYNGYEQIEETGKASNIFELLNKFRVKINEDNFSKKMKNEDAKAVAFELKKIKVTVEKLLKEFD